MQVLTCIGTSSPLSRTHCSSSSEVRLRALSSPLPPSGRYSPSSDSSGPHTSSNHCRRLLAALYTHRQRNARPSLHHRSQDAALLARLPRSCMGRLLCIAAQSTNSSSSSNTSSSSCSSIIMRALIKSSMRPSSRQHSSMIMATTSSSSRNSSSSSSGPNRLTQALLWLPPRPHHLKMTTPRSTQPHLPSSSSSSTSSTWTSLAPPLQAFGAKHAQQQQQRAASSRSPTKPTQQQPLRARMWPKRPQPPLPAHRALMPPTHVQPQTLQLLCVPMWWQRQRRRQQLRRLLRMQRPWPRW
mmetsp:Transcript_22293/g.58131  ORF Transcript_22293/g.58131 Transcript_22293/m.58131 type:complete len:298 (-) Transcript_22293:66-959(-)